MPQTLSFGLVFLWLPISSSSIFPNILVAFGILALQVCLWKLTAVETVAIYQWKECYTCFTSTSLDFPPSVVTITGWCLVLWRRQQAQQPQKESRIRRRQERESNHCHQEHWGPQAKIIAILRCSSSLNWREAVTPWDFNVGLSGTSM